MHFIMSIVIIAAIHLGFLKLLQWDPRYVAQLQSATLPVLLITALVYAFVVSTLVAVVGLWV